MLYLQSEIQINLIMSEKEFKSFRFTENNDPSDEMLMHLMQKVADQAREENKLAKSRFFETLRNEAIKQRSMSING